MKDDDTRSQLTRQIEAHNNSLHARRLAVFAASTLKFTPTMLVTNDGMLATDAVLKPEHKQELARLRVTHPDSEARRLFDGSLLTRARSSGAVLFCESLTSCACLV